MTSLADLVRSLARNRPDDPAITSAAGRLTFAELDRRSSRVANALQAEGVGAQDRVAFWGKNSPALFELLFGAAKINAVTVALNWRLAPTESNFILNDSEAQVLVVGPEFLPQLEQIRGQLQMVKKVIVDDGSFQAWAGEASADDPGDRPALDDVTLQLYTSGTTGLPKGVMLSNRSLFSMLPGTATAWDFGASTVNLVAMPLYHVGGVGWALVGMYVGAHTVLLREAITPDILAAIAEHRVTHALFVPAVLQALLAAPGVERVDFSTLQYIVYGASPISVATLSAAIARFGCRFFQGYGLTETCGAVIHLLPEDHDPGGPLEHRLRAAGITMPGAQMRVVDPVSGTAAGTGEVGEIQLRAPQVMAGYWKRPEETRAAYTDDGWLRSGDAGYLDADGYLYISDRVKDMIISGSENIYPAEIENVLMSHPAVADVAVIGVPSERWGESPLAVVVRTPGTEASSEQLVAWCRERLATYKAPARVEFAESLPRNPTGKVLKHELRAPYWAGLSRSVH